MQMLSASINKDTCARDRILFTAHDLFYQDGVRVTGVDRLIAQAAVTKTTFYRHFPSKKHLIIEFLELRHRNWINWFKTRIEAHGSQAPSISLSIAEWLNSEGFRGCAFLNSVGELGAQMNEVREITQRHKRDVVTVISQIVNDHQKASAIALAIDGAILNVQFGHKVEQVVAGLDYIIKAASA